ncbi:menaquinone-dependent protoporphyrinogen oxidase [Roseovarius litoreus]|uniref:Menaquinone-dependent protoporphyrinogen oxidase n=1 Tax=Roseovarius litoreus TaxID=1155722 RepID=A0A1M7FM09_9RHOB|nr:flavodoxin domain-containing protein [Roseovarius litoreus]SHM05020.1 menaquinone-dependent protoporphyrinogen oxidase [Roseovarius litoreus]
MKILIVYATTEGQTRRICQVCSDTLIAAGHSVELLQASGADEIDIARFDAAILAASLHMQHYQKEMAHFAAEHAEALGHLPTVFLSVSLAIVGGDPDELADLETIAQRFFEDTGWHPRRVEQIAGAFRFTQYDFLKSWAMRWVASQKGQTVDPNADTEYTDWTALKAMVSDWAAKVDKAC